MTYMNRLATNKRTAVIAALVEGVSVNATCRITGVAKHTALKLLEDIGCACAAYHDTHVRDIHVRRVQCDEAWSFVYAKQKNVTAEQMAVGAGDCWTWVAEDADTKLIISYLLGDRGAATAKTFMQDVASRINNRIQLTTDGHRVYAEAVEDAFGADVDYAMLVKLYGSSGDSPESRYSPATCIGCRTGVLVGPRHRADACGHLPEPRSAGHLCRAALRRHEPTTDGRVRFVLLRVPLPLYQRD